MHNKPQMITMGFTNDPEPEVTVDNNKNRQLTSLGFLFLADINGTPYDRIILKAVISQALKPQ